MSEQKNVILAAVLSFLVIVVWQVFLAPEQLAPDPATVAADARRAGRPGARRTRPRSPGPERARRLARVRAGGGAAHSPSETLELRDSSS
jgi:hypothetical protein